MLALGCIITRSSHFDIEASIAALLSFLCYRFAIFDSYLMRAISAFRSSRRTALDFLMSRPSCLPTGEDRQCEYVRASPKAVTTATMPPMAAYGI